VAAAKRGYGSDMYAEVATLQVLLEGVPLPAEKSELIAYARAQDGDSGAATELLELLPDREYKSLDEVGEALAPVQPAAGDEAELPRAESDLPPGGDDYVDPSPVPGGVRHDAPPDNPPQKAIEEQAKTQNEQKERQEKHLGS
jgi:hypothetical protein